MLMPNEEPTTQRASPSQGLVWTDICALEEILPASGVCVMLAGEQIAVFRLLDDSTVYALSNFDPFSKAFVLSRGLVGDRAGVPKVASPIFKQSFSLHTGECLDDSSIRLPTYPVRVIDGRVQLGLTSEAHDRS